jgi:hypothetical protein
VLRHYQQKTGDTLADRYLHRLTRPTLGGGPVQI